jgi:hypothetical protein
VSNWVGMYSGGSCAADATVTTAVSIASLPTLLPMIRAHFGARGMRVMLNVAAVAHELSELWPYFPQSIEVRMRSVDNTPHPCNRRGTW